MITAVVAANKNYNLTKSWYENFRKRFPDQLLAISCLQCQESDLENYVSSLKSSVTRVIVGSPLDNHSVSFSESYNAALNLVETDKFVFIHNDMQFTSDFFELLEKELDSLGKGSFVHYMCVEAPVFTAHHRVGKVIHSWSGMEDFNNYVLGLKTRLPELSSDEVIGWFFRAGWVSDIHKIGGFDQNTYKVFCEDLDLVLRTRLAGYKTYQSNWACVYHFVSQTANTLDRDELEKISARKFYQKWGIEPYQLYSLPFDKIENIIRAGKMGIVSSFAKQCLEPNYLDLQKRVKYKQ